MRKRVVAIITWPLRFLRRLLGLLSRSLRKLGKRRTPSTKPGTPSKKRGTPVKQLATRSKQLATPVKKLAGLRGRQRIAALVILGGVVLVVILSTRPGPDEEKNVRATLDRYATASAKKDYQTLCDDLLSSQLVNQIRNAGLPCEVALRTGLEDRKSPTLTVLGVEVNGDQALANVRGTAVGEVPGTSTYRLVRERGSWRIATSPTGPGDGSGAAP